MEEEEEEEEDEDEDDDDDYKINDHNTTGCRICGQCIFQPFIFSKFVDLVSKIR